MQPPRYADEGTILESMQGETTTSQALNLPDARRQLLEKYLKGQLAPIRSRAAAIARSAVGGPAPLSYRQEQIWLHAKLAGAALIYNEPITIHRFGPLDAAALLRSFNEIIRRHEVWRTTFPCVDGLPVQVVHPSPEVEIPLVDLRQLASDQREAEALRLATEDARKPFDLTNGPLLRAKLVRLADEEHRLFLTLHHIIFDGVSIYGVLLPELIALYDPFSTGKPSPLAEPPIQYADFAHWQRQWLQEKTISEHMAYWKKQLSGDLPVVQLPADRPRPAVQTFRGAMQTFAVSRRLAAELKMLSQREGVSLFITLLAAFNTLLYRYSGQEDMLVGSATAGRNRAETEKLIGFFLNTVVLRTDVSGNPSFLELLQRVRQVTLEALSNDDVPFEHVVKELQPKRDLSRNPLFQVLFSLEPPLPALDSSWKLTQMDVETGAAKFDLYLELDERPEGIIGRFTYSTDLFDAPTISRMAEHWQKLLEGIVANPAQPLSELPLLTDAERHQVLVEWNDTRRDYAQVCVHELFEAQVNRNSDAIAVTFENQQLSYRELNRRANQLAHYLRNLGVGPEVLVGICVQRSIEMVVGLLGILKAGGAYLPLDPVYPKARLRDVLKNAGVKVLLSQKKIRGRLPRDAAQMVWLDTEWKAISRESSENLKIHVSPKDLAYVIYTSGSTGMPKGVQIEHRSVANLLTSMQREPGLSRDDVLLAVTMLSFDIAGLEVYLPLVVGAKLVVAGREVTRDGSMLKALLADSGATVMQATPATWRLLLDSGWEGGRDLKILCGGEALPPELARELVARSSSVWNLYGPTETTIWSAIHRVDGKEEGRIPIGHPIANTELYILNNERQPVPVGVEGELYIGGDGLARGYLEHPQLTTEKFVPHPFRSEPGARLYRTGDLARYRRNGNVEYLARIDNQIKIRGFRIELGEIQAVLSQHVGVSQSLVMLRDHRPGERLLVAYIIKAAGRRAPTKKELRSYLKKKLPDYMVPDAFVMLDKLPLTQNGKVDRCSLPAPDQRGLVLQERFAAPSDFLESKLAQIWESLLGISPIGIRHNFFDLGGHSLLAARLIHRIEQTFSKKLSINNLFEAPTIEQLATILRDPSSLSRLSRVVPIQPAGSRPPFFCIGAGPLFWPLAQRLGTDQPFLGLGLQESDKDRLRAPYTLAEIAGCLVKSMRELQPEGPYFLGGWCGDGLIAYETARQLWAQGQNVALLALIETQNPARSNTFSTVMRVKLLAQRLGFHFANLWHLGITGSPQLQELLRKIKRLRWRTTYNLRLYLSNCRLRDLEQILYVAARTYQPQPYPGCVVLFRCAERPVQPNWAGQSGWSELVAGGLEVYEIPGNHKTIFLEPNVDILASKLRTCLCRTQ
jgi:amino acid adenylation domain-containing protein